MSHRFFETQFKFRRLHVIRITSKRGGISTKGRRPRKKRIDTNPTVWDYPTMIVTIDSKRRLTVPAALASTAPGDYFDAQFDSEEDAIVFRRIGAKSDWLTVIKECPVPMDDLPPRRRELPRHRKL